MFSARLRRYALGLGLLVLVAVAVAQLQGGATAPTGTRVGDLRVELSDGSVIALERYRGEVVVLNFWATWCAPCRKEAPILTGLHADGVRVIGVAVDQAAFPELLSAAEEIGIAYPIAKGSPEMLARLSVEVVPTTYVIGRDGTIAWARTGLVARQELERVIEAARTPG